VFLVVVFTIDQTWQTNLDKSANLSFKYDNFALIIIEDHIEGHNGLGNFKKSY